MNIRSWGLTVVVLLNTALMGCGGGGSNPVDTSNSGGGENPSSSSSAASAASTVSAGGTASAASTASPASAVTAGPAASAVTTTPVVSTPSVPVVLPIGGACDVPRGDASAPVFASGHPKVLLNHAATLTCLKGLMANGTPSAVRFKAYVDSEVARPGANWGFQTWWVALMYQVNGAPAYADFAVSKVDAFVASEEAKIALGQVPTVASDSYLDVGRLVGDVALVYDWCYPRLTVAQRTRWIAYMNQAVTNVWNPSRATWGSKVVPWSGWSVNNPSNNYYYSFLRATMLLGLATRGENPTAPTWIDQFRTTKVANELLPLFNRDLTGGGSREGTGYGVAMKGLFQLYDWWERSTGERIATATPHTLASTAWMLHNIVPTLDFLSATGDQARDSSVALFDYHREYLLSLMTLFPQERMSSMAKIVLDGSSVPKVSNGFESFVDYLYQPPALPTASIADLSTSYWGPGTGQLFMRSAWGDKTAVFSNLTCGPFTESHAHRDQGAFQLYRGEWLAPTTNIYTHSGIEQQEELNNLVRVQLNGSTIRQVNGAPKCDLAALAENDYFTYGVAKVTPVYNGNASISKVEREYLFIKPSTFVVFDRVASVAGTRRVWTLNLPGAPVINGDRLTFTGAKSNRLDVYRVAPGGLNYQVSTPTLVEPSDTLSNANAKRVDVVDTAGLQSQFLHVMGTNGSVSSVVRSDASGQTGVVVQLADGRAVTVRFGNNTTGGTLDIRQGSGAVQFGGALPASVTAPPLFRN